MSVTGRVAKGRSLVCRGTGPESSGGGEVGCTVRSKASWVMVTCGPRWRRATIPLLPGNEYLQNEHNMKRSVTDEKQERSRMNTVTDEIKCHHPFSVVNG